MYNFSVSWVGRINQICPLQCYEEDRTSKNLAGRLAPLETYAHELAAMAGGRQDNVENLRTIINLSKHGIVFHLPMAQYPKRKTVDIIASIIEDFCHRWTYPIPDTPAFKHMIVTAATIVSFHPDPPRATKMN